MESHIATDDSELGPQIIPWIRTSGACANLSSTYTDKVISLALTP